jgi:hypothetical protein
MGQVLIGDHVEAQKGKRQGLIGKVTSTDGDRVLVQFDGLQYEMSYAKTDVKVVRKASDDFKFSGDEVPQDFHGEKRTRAIASLVKQGKLCPSWPHQCSGECQASKTEKGVKAS